MDNPEDAHVCDGTIASELTSPMMLVTVDKIKKINSQCNNCGKAKTRCDKKRPCGRCVKLNKEDSCADVEAKQRGRPMQDQVIDDVEKSFDYHASKKRKRHNDAEVNRRRKMADSMVFLADLCEIEEKNRTRPHILTEAVKKIQTLGAEHRGALGLLLKQIGQLTYANKMIKDMLADSAIKIMTISDQAVALTILQHQNDSLRQELETLKKGVPS